MFKNNKSVVFVLSLLALVGTATSVKAKPNVDKNGLRPQLKGQLKTTASCRPAESSVDLDINNVRARIMTGGDMWWDNGTQEARYEVPKGQRKNSLFAGSVWVGGIDVQKQLKVAAQTYRQSGNDYWPGPLDAAANVEEATCNAWDNFWKINASDIARFREISDKSSVADDPAYQAIFTWPAKGNINPRGRNNAELNLIEGRDYAPFVDVDGNSKYNPTDGGDYPEINGDQYIWWVFNDKGNVKQQSQTEGIGMEVQASAFGYTRQDAMNDATFYNYRLINRGVLTLDSCYMATWTDADLGYANDDFIGCDTARGLGVLYNARSVDGQGEVTSYGAEVPMVGVDFFLGPTKYYDTVINGQPSRIGRRMPMQVFTYFNNDNSIIGNPNNGAQIYNYMTGSILTGQRFSYDFAGPGVTSRGFGSGPTIPFVFPGDPSNKNAWSECTCNNPPGDRRFIHSAGAFRLDPGVVNDVTIGAVWVSNVGGCPNTSFKKIQAADDLAQALFNNNFRAIEGPEAPRVVIREMDRKLVFYLTNDPNSNNYQEKFGYDLSEQKFRVSALTTKALSVPDSLYKFEGYRVFQLRDGNVRAADVFLPSGAVNTELAIEVFQTDLKNGVKQIVNYNKDLDVEGSFNSVVKLTGKDSGIRHSFEITNDQFATGFDKKLVNYRNYYFVAIAYAYNNFRPFKYDSLVYSQDLTYLGSEKGQGGTAIPIVVGMPNPANGNMGTVINSDYGSGVIIKRVEGRGNGGNEIDMDAASEAEAIVGPEYQNYYPVYQPGKGPVNVRVVDPLKVQAADWELYISGQVGDPLPPDLSYGLADSTASWTLINKTDGTTIYSERNLTVANEQILEKYGLSVTINQVVRPGDDQAGKNGYITSSISYDDVSKPWLAGVPDAEARDFRNWIRSGGVQKDSFDACDFNDRVAPGFDTVTQVYEHLLSQFTTTRGTWAPYGLGAQEEENPGFPCGFGITREGTSPRLWPIPSIDIVFTSDKSKWTRCVVIEMQPSTTLAEGGTKRWRPRGHAGWNGEVAGDGTPIYSAAPEDRGMSWFPGYAINQETGERLNIAFGEDSWLKNYNGSDMIWNPTSEDIITQELTGQTLNVFGGKHFVYVFGTKYDECKSFKEGILKLSELEVDIEYRKIMWTGMPLLAQGQRFLPLSENLIPTTTRLRFRVDRPYAPYITNTVSGIPLRNNGNPLYEFSTKGLEPLPLTNNSNADKDRLIERIGVVPNPYYAYGGYERNRLDTRVRIINLPAKASIFIYTLDGALVRSLTKDNANQSYIDWDLRNARGLAISSGMYLIHVKADGIGETVLKWFGALRPIDITTY